jgi:ABC-type amino acid transport system permease subunit
MRLLSIITRFLPNDWMRYIANFSIAAYNSIPLYLSTFIFFFTFCNIFSHHFQCNGVCQWFVVETLDVAFSGCLKCLCALLYSENA